MKRPLTLGDLLSHHALPWVMLACAVVVTLGMLLLVFTHRTEAAQDRLVRQNQRLALDLALAAQSAPPGHGVKQLLSAHTIVTPTGAYIAVDDVTGQARVPLYRSNPSRPAQSDEAWLSDTQTVAVLERRWEVRLEQPAHALFDPGINHDRMLGGGLLVIGILCLLFWGLQRQNTRDQARKSYRLLQSVMDALPVPVFVKDAAHRYRLLNRAFGEAFRVDVAQLIGQTDRAIHDEVTTQARFDEDDLALRSGEIVVSSQSDSDLQGRAGHWLKRKAAFNLPEGGLGQCGILTEITAQRIAEGQARSTSQFMEEVLDALPQPMYVKNEHSEWVLVNDAFARLMNRPKSELLGRSDAEFWDPEIVQRYRAHDLEAMHRTDAVAREEEVTLPDGRTVNLMTNKHGLVSASGARHVVAVIFDVTDLRRSARDLAHAHQFQDAIIDALPHSLVVKDEAGHYLIVNRAWCDAVAMDKDRVLGRTAGEIFPPNIASQLEAQDREAWATGGTVTAVQPRINLRGKAGWSLKSKRAVLLPNGQRFNVQVTTDVTAHQEALHEARRSRELLRGVLDSIPNPLIVKDTLRRFALVNAAAAALGLPGGLKVGMTDRDAFPEDVCARYREEDELALSDLQTRWYSDYRIDAQGNERWWVKSKRAIVVTEDEKLIVSVLSDVTALKMAERKLVRNQSRLQVLHELSMLILLQPDLSALGKGVCEILARCLDDCRISYAEVNEAGQVKVVRSMGAAELAALTGWCVDLASMPALWHQFRHLDLISSVDLEPQDCYRAWRGWWPENQAFKTLFVPLTIGPRLSAIVLIDAPQAREWAPHELQVVQETVDHLRIACQAQRAELARASAESALRDSETELRRHRDNLQALVEARTADLLQAVQTAEAANQSKSQFFNCMSHELRTPMNSILSFARLGLERVRAGTLNVDVTRQYLERIEKSAGRLLLLINDLLDLAKLESGRMTYRFAARDMRRVIASVCEELAALAAKAGTAFKIECHLAEPPMAWCDELRMEQVMRNLLSNALRYAPPGTTIDIALKASMMVLNGAGDADPDDDGESQAIQVGDALEITVADHGPGIPAGEFDQIFDKYVQSSRVRGGGTGLGLPIAREIVLHHRGLLFASNGPDGGAVLTLTLPLAPPKGAGVGGVGGRQESDVLAPRIES